MIRAICSILASFVGLILSAGLAFLVYVLLEYSYGAGGNSEGTATQTQRFYSSIAAPFSLCIACMGIASSAWLVFKMYSTHDKTEIRQIAPDGVDKLH